jgi:hypothetical protein
MKVDVDAHLSEHQFQVGEQVLLKLHPFAQSTVVSRPCPKLALKYFGPYKVVEKVGTMAYKLELPHVAQVHPIFHVSQLKSFTPDYTPVFAELPTPPKLDLCELEPELILDRRLTKKGNSVVTQILVKWKTLPETMATWEDYIVL